MNIHNLPKSYLIPIAIVILASLWILSGYITRKIPTLQLREEAPFHVQVADIKAQSKEILIKVQGHTKPFCSIDLRCEVDGKIIFILEKGQYVEKDQPLAKLQLKDREAHYAKSKARYNQRELAYRAAVRLAKKGFRSPHDVALSKALLDEAKAELETARYEVENATIKAPFSGVLDDKKAELGDYVLKGDKILTLLNLNPVRAVGFIQEQDVGKISLEQAALLTLKSGEKYQGKISFIAATADPQTRMFQIELTLPNPRNKIPGGLTAEIQIPLEKTSAHFITPAILTLKDDGTVGVKIVTPEDIVQFCPVQIVASENAGIWVKGLPDEARIITVGQEFVIENQKVSPVFEKNQKIP